MVVFGHSGPWFRMPKKHLCLPQRKHIYCWISSKETYIYIHIFCWIVERSHRTIYRSPQRRHILLLVSSKETCMTSLFKQNCWYIYIGACWPRCKVCAEAWRRKFARREEDWPCRQARHALLFFCRPFSGASPFLFCRPLRLVLFYSAGHCVASPCTSPSPSCAKIFIQCKQGFPNSHRSWKRWKLDGGDNVWIQNHKVLLQLYLRWGSSLVQRDQGELLTLFWHCSSWQYISHRSETMPTTWDASACLFPHCYYLQVSRVIGLER